MPMLHVSDRQHPISLTKIIIFYAIQLDNHTSYIVYIETH